MKISKISWNNSAHACIVLKWLWSSWEPDEKLKQTLISFWNEIHHFCRNGDSYLEKSPDTINEYLEKLKDYVLYLINQWKSVELFWVSFWWYLALRLAWEMKEKVNSVVAVATLLDPLKIISARATQNPENDEILDILTSTWVTVPVHKWILESLKWQEVKEISQSWLIVLWNWFDGLGDWFETIDNLDLISWKFLKKVVINWALHRNTLEHIETLKEVKNFYRRIIIA